MDLDQLNLEYCNLESFFPKGLGKLTQLSLMGNQVTNFNQFILTDDTQEEVRNKGSEFGRLSIPEIKLTDLNLSDN